MDDTALSERESQVLCALIQAHVDSGMPIGSRLLLERECWEFSAATVRNTLARLEEKGCVYQPHTSAGRVPTDRAYKHYVEQCMADGQFWREENYPAVERELELELREGDMDEILGQLAKIIGNISQQLGLVMAPKFDQGVLRRLELVELAEKRLLLVATIDRGLVKSLVMEIDAQVSRRELQITTRKLNECLQGLTLNEIRRTVRQRLESLEMGNPQLLRIVAEEMAEMALLEEAELHVAGAGNICLQPEFHDPRKVAELMDLVESRDLLTRLLWDREGVVVTIGAENTPPREMSSCSVVTASYKINDVLGVIGVIGPTRMPYGRLVSLVNYAASRATQLISQ